MKNNNYYKKTNKIASNTFHNIMSASVKGNPKPKEQHKNANYSLLIENIEIPTRLQSILKSNGIKTLKELASYDAIELLQFKNIGIKYISLIENSIKKYGLRLGDFIK